MTRNEIVFVVLAVILAITSVRAQSADQKAPAFEVASIKPSKSIDRLSGIQHQPGGRLTITNMTLRTLVTFAYHITGYQLVGGPGWADRDTSTSSLG